jgi:hypothetical protein
LATWRRKKSPGFLRRRRVAGRLGVDVLAVGEEVERLVERVLHVDGGTLCVASCVSAPVVWVQSVPMPAAQAGSIAILLLMALPYSLCATT